MSQERAPELLPRLEKLRRELRSRSRGKGYQAADRLAQAGPEGRELLLRALESRDRNVRLHAAWAVRLLDAPTAVQRLVEMLRLDREAYLALQQALAPAPPREVLESLLRAARDPRNANRKFHLMLLGDVEGPGVLDVLLAALQSDDSEAQEGAFLACKHARPTLRDELGPALVQALSVRLPLPSRRPWALTARGRARQAVPSLLIGAVGLVAGSPGVGVLIEILRSQAHVSYLLAAVSALATVGEPAVGRCWPVLVDLVEEPHDGELAAFAAEALRRLRAGFAEERLLCLLEEGRPHQRRNAAHALEGCGGEASLAGLLKALEEADVHVRRTAARSLGRLKGGRAVEDALIRALDDPDRWVGWNAAWALGRRGEESVVPRLLAGLEAASRRLRRHSAEALGQLGACVPEVVEGLVAVLEERHPEVPRTAAWALRQLDVAEAFSYARLLAESPDPANRRLGRRALRWLQPERASYAPHLPVRSSRLTGVISSPDEEEK